MRRHYDIWSTTVISLTVVLFVAALLLKGFVHDMLLEAGIFLVSVKLILMAHRNHVVAERTEKRLQQIHALLQEQKT